MLNFDGLLFLQYAHALPHHVLWDHCFGVYTIFARRRCFFIFQHRLLHNLIGKATLTISGCNKATFTISGVPLSNSASNVGCCKQQTLRQGDAHQQWCCCVQRCQRGGTLRVVDAATRRHSPLVVSMCPTLSATWDVASSRCCDKVTLTISGVTVSNSANDVGRCE